MKIEEAVVHLLAPAGCGMSTEGRLIPGSASEEGI